MRHQGLPSVQLSVVAYAVIISRLLYALPAWETLPMQGGHTKDVI